MIDWHAVWQLATNPMPAAILIKLGLVLAVIIMIWSDRHVAR